MKVVITGHSNGLGKVLAKEFESKGYTVSGYDLSDNKDVKDESVVNDLLLDCKDADIFVNNAYGNQRQLLDKVFNAWLGDNRTIINISSAVTYKTLNPEITPDIKDYFTEKRNLDQWVHLCRRKSSLPKIMNVRPSWFESDLVKRFEVDKMQPADVAELIVSLYEMSNKLQILDIVLEK